MCTLAKHNTIIIMYESDFTCNHKPSRGGRDRVFTTKLVKDWIRSYDRLIDKIFGPPTHPMIGTPQGVDAD